MAVAGKSRTFVIAITIALVLAAIGFALSLFLIPSDSDVAELIAIERATPDPMAPVLSEKSIEINKQQFLDELASGAITYHAAEAYAQSLISGDRMQEAAHVWKEYLEINTQDLRAWKEFGRLSLAAKDEESYLLALEIIAKIEPTEENLAALSGYQSYRKDYVGQVETLKKLISMSNEQNPQYLLDLADVAGLAEDDEAALAALTGYYGKYAAGQPVVDAAVDAVSTPAAMDGAEPPVADGEVAQAAAENVSEAGAQEDVSQAPAVEDSQKVEAPDAPEAVALTDNADNANNDVPPPPPLLEGVEVEKQAASDAPAEDAVAAEMASATDAGAQPDVAPEATSPAATTAVTTAATANGAVDYSRVPTYVRLLIKAERGADALAEALRLTRSGDGQAVRSQVAEVLLYEAGPDMAVEYIQTLSSQQEVPEDMHAVYARALVQQGKYENALPMLKQLSAEGGDYREWYFLALSAAAKKDREARRELLEHTKEGFASGELTEAQKLDRVYALLNAGEKTQALDFAERSMHASEDPEFKKKWVDLYRALTVKPKPVRVARVVPRVSLDQKLALSRQAGASDDYIRKTAFELLAGQRKDDAVELFSGLAAKNGATSSDAGQLLYLWGARISGSELGWIVERAAAGGGDQSGWVSAIANHAAAEDVIAIAQNYPDWLRYDAFEKRYVDSLMSTGNNEALAQYVAAQANSTQTVDVYHAIASKAQSLMDMRTAEQSLQKAAQTNPSDRETWLKMASMYLSRARYTAAEQSVVNAFNAGPQPSISQQQAARQELEANYYAGALAKRRGDYEEADAYFSRAINAGNGAQLEDNGSQVKLLSAHMALGNEQQGAQGFEELLEYSPGDATLLADYMSALLDRGSYLQAIDVAGRHGYDVSLDNAMSINDPSPLVIAAPGGVAPLMQSMAGGQELKLVFDRPLPNGHQLIANQQKPDWVAYTSASYDTALIVAQSGYTLQAAQTPQGLVVSAAPVPDAMGAEATRQRYLRLQLLYARLELETDAVDMAVERLESLAPTYQEYPEYRAYQGNAEYYAGNLKRGLNLVKRAQVGDPGNEDIRYLRRNIERFHGEHLKLDHEFRRLGDSDMQITTLEARKQFDNSIEVMARYQNNMLDTAIIQRAFGPLQRVDSNRWQAEMSLAKFMDDSSIIEGSIYANKSDFGAGLSYQFVNSLGTTNIYGEWHKPYWDVIEAVVEDATRDRLAAWHLWRPSPKWTFRGDAGFNRYHIDEKSNIADAVGVKGLVLRTLYDKQPYVAVAYGFDGEYFVGSKARNGGNTGNKLLPLRSREIHSLSGIFYQDFSADTNGELSLGYAVDRLGEHGPAVEGRLTHYLAEEVDVQVRARYGLEAGNTDNDALSVGGYVRWTW